MILDRPARGVGVEAQAAAEAGLAAQPAEDEVGIRDRRPRAALAVAGGSRHGFGAHRPDAQRPAIVDPGDRPAARPDGVDVDDRQPDRDLADPGIARRLRPAVADQADVGAGAADIHGDDGVGFDQTAEMRAGDDAAGRARQHGVHRPRQRRLHRHQPARGLHHHDGLVAPDAETALRIAQPGRQRAEVLGHDRRQEGVEHRRAGALELAELAQDVGGDADDDAGQLPLEHRLGLALVRRVGVGVQEDHGNRLDALGAHVRGGRLQVRSGERLDLAPAGIDPPADAVAQLARHQGGRAHDIDIVEARPVLPPDQQEIAKAARRDEGGLGAAALDHGVGRRRHAMADVVDRAALGAQLRKRPPQALDGALLAGLRRRRHLGDADPPRDGIVGDAVGERAANVRRDPDLHGPLPAQVWSKRGYAHIGARVHPHRGCGAPVAPSVSPVARWKAAAMAAALASAKASASTVMPSGRPSARKPDGTAMPHRPIRLTKLV